MTDSAPDTHGRTAPSDPPALAAAVPPRDDLHRVATPEGLTDPRTIYKDEYVGAVENAIGEYSELRKWDDASKVALIMSILGLLDYEVPLRLEDQ